MMPFFMDSGAPLIEGAIEQRSISKFLFCSPSLYVKKHIIKIGPIINWSIETFFVRLNKVLPVNFLSAKIILNYTVIYWEIKLLLKTWDFETHHRFSSGVKRKNLKAAILVPRLKSYFLDFSIHS